MVLVTHELEQEIRRAVADSLYEWAERLGFGLWAAEDAAVKAVRDHRPSQPPGRSMDGYCYGTKCQVQNPAWRVRSAPTLEDPMGGVWLGACARHLNWVCDDLTAGEQMELVVERQRTDER